MSTEHKIEQTCSEFFYSNGDERRGPALATIIRFASVVDRCLTNPDLYLISLASSSLKEMLPGLS